MLWLLGGFFVIAWAIFVKHKWIPIIIAMLLFGQGFAWSGSLEFILFILGVVLLALELYIPDFGMAGGLGLLAVNYAAFDLLGNWTGLVQLNIGAILLVLVALYFANLLGYQLQLSPGLVLETSLREEEGYQAYKVSPASIGMQGKVFEPLKPVGRVDFEGNLGMQEVISTRGYVQPGTRVKIEKISGKRLYVVPLEEEVS